MKNPITLYQQAIEQLDCPYYQYFQGDLEVYFPPQMLIFPKPWLPKVFPFKYCIVSQPLY